jgi:adenylate cyclase
LNIGRTTRDAIVIAAIAVVCAGLSVSPALERVHGLSLDILTALRWEMFGRRHNPSTSPTVVVAIDEESYRVVPFKGSPTMTWTGEIGRVLAAIVEGGAKVVGMDLVIENSIEQSEIPFGEGTLGDKVRGFDRDFLRALRTAAVSGKVVLGEVLRGEQPIRPSQGQRIAVQQQQNIRPLNTFLDGDDTVRRVPLAFAVDGTRLPGIALELASRALKAAPEFGSNGSVALAGYQIPVTVPNTMTVNFEGGADDIPTFSFADLRACALKNDKDYFKRWFDGKVVIFGTVLDGEDRRLTSKRFATGVEGARAPYCASEQKPVMAGFRRSSIAGIYIHATAVNNLIRQDAAIELEKLPTFLIATLIATLAAIGAFLFRPIGAVAAFAVLTAVGLADAVVAFKHELVIPVTEPFLAGLAALAATVGYRFKRMLSSNKLPELGGETRNVTVFFSDIEGFSLIAEKMAPDGLMSLMNEYLSEMTDIIESHGGYVDKYIGDSIVAVFGAPADDRDHAANAARAALGCCRRLAEINRDSATFRESKLAQRIGINSGEALVGNFGSRRRFNYSVMSDAVNLASRLEGANKFYGTTVIASETTVGLAGEPFAWRELDTLRVKGRTQALKIYELLAYATQLTPAQQTVMADYAEGLVHWRAGELSLAESCFERSTQIDRPSSKFLERVRQYKVATPDGEWDPIRTLEEK